MHAWSPGHSPWSLTSICRLRSHMFFESECYQPLASSTRLLPLSPENISYLAPDPPVQALEYPAFFCYSKIIDPSSSDRHKLLSDAFRQFAASHLFGDAFYFAFKAFNAAFVNCNPVRFFSRCESESQKFAIPRVIHCALLLIDLELEFLGQISHCGVHDAFPCFLRLTAIPGVNFPCGKIGTGRNFTPNFVQRKLQNSLREQNSMIAKPIRVLRKMTYPNEV